MNKDKLKDWIGQVGYVRLILLGICGVLLILFSIPDKKSDGKENEKIIIEANAGENDLYVEKMEQKLKYILEKMKGVGKAEVMITLSSSAEKIVNKDRKEEQDSEVKQGEEDSTKTGNKKEEETVFASPNGNGTPYVIKEQAPLVEGVIAVIEGGDDPVVVEAVTDAIKALFHVEAHKIKVLKMEDES